MDEQTVIETLTTILQDLLEDPSITLSSTTVREDVAGWDSFAYVNFIVAVETELGIRFRVADVESFQSVGDIVNEISELTS